MRGGLGDFLLQREKYGQNANTQRVLGEELAVTRGKLITIHSSPMTKSTISISFSSDGATLATSHGDHTIKLFCSYTYLYLGELVGHPRTVWTVKFHPFTRGLVASGCLGGECRVWNCETQECIFMTTVNREIVSISFHPVKEWIAIGSGAQVFIWDYRRARQIVLLKCDRNVRCVGFCGSCNIIVGEPAPESDLYMHNITGRSELTVRLQLVRFGPCVFENNETSSRVLLENTVLYSDGGFDISSCGRLLYAVSYTNCNLVPLTRRLDIQDELLSPPKLRRINNRGSYSLVAVNLHTFEVETFARLHDDFARGVTSVKRSPSNSHLVLGYGVPSRQIEYTGRIAIVFSNINNNFKTIAVIKSEQEADLNMICFHPRPECGLVYGTRLGTIVTYGISSIC